MKTKAKIVQILKVAGEQNIGKGIEFVALDSDGTIFFGEPDLTTSSGQPRVITWQKVKAQYK